MTPDEYPRVQPGELRREAARLTILATLADRNVPLPGEDLRAIAILLDTAAEDIEDMRRVPTPRELVRR